MRRGDYVTVALQGDHGKPRPAIVARWNAEIVKALEAPEVRTRMNDASMALNYVPPEKMGAYIRATSEAFDKLFSSTGIKLDD